MKLVGQFRFNEINLFFPQHLLSSFTRDFKLQNPGEENYRELFRLKRKVMNSFKIEMRKKMSQIINLKMKKKRKNQCNQVAEQCSVNTVTYEIENIFHLKIDFQKYISNELNQ